MAGQSTRPMTLAGKAFLPFPFLSPEPDAALAIASSASKAYASWDSFRPSTRASSNAARVNGTRWAWSSARSSGGPSTSARPAPLASRPKRMARLRCHPSRLASSLVAAAFSDSHTSRRPAFESNLV